MTLYSNILHAVRGLAKGIQPSFDLSELLYRHRCYYLLSLLTSSTAHTQKASAELMLHRVILQERYRACRSLFDALKQNGIPFAVIKGAALARSAYEDEGYRFSGDIDILIERKNIDRLKTYASNTGFTQGRITSKGIVPFTRQELLFHVTMTHQTAPFIKANSHPLCPYVNIDVNTDIFWGESERNADISRFLDDAVTSTICGTNVPVLSPEKAFIQLCLHHYKDMNSLYLLSTSGLRLSHLCDIYYCAINTHINRHTLYSLCEEFHATPYIGFCLYYADCVFDDPRLRKYLNGIPAEMYEPFLEQYGLTPDEHKAWNMPFEERLFCDNLTSVVRESLSETEIHNIQTNKNFMQ